MRPVLHHAWDAVCPIKVRMCLHEKGVEYNHVAYDIAALGHLVPSYLTLNPDGVLPTLVDGSTIVVESSIINAHIDEAFAGPPLQPTVAALRAEMRTWVQFQDNVLHPATRPHTFSLMLTHPRSPLKLLTEAEIEARLLHHPDPGRVAMFRQMLRNPASPNALAAAETTLDRALSRIQHRLSDGRPWLVGDALSLADIAMVGVIDRLEHCGLSHLWKTRPCLDRWVARLQERPSYRAAIPTQEQRLPGPLNP